MQLIPFERFVVSTGAGAEQVVEMFARELEWSRAARNQTPSRGFGVSAPGLDGWVNREGFSVCRNRRWPGPGAVCRGRFEAQDGGTVVRMWMGPHTLGLVIGGFMVALVAVVMVGLLVAGAVLQNAVLLAVGAFAGFMLLVGYASVMLTYSRDAGPLRDRVAWLLSQWQGGG